MGKRQKVAAIGRPSDGVDDGEDYSSSDVELSDGEDYSSPDLSSDELSDDPRRRPRMFPLVTKIQHGIGLRTVTLYSAP